MHNSFESPNIPREVSTSGQSIDSEQSDSEWTFKKYMDELDLTSEDLRGKRILDVGANDALFEKFAREQNINATITSVDPRPDPSATGVVMARAESLPMADGAFDMALSTSAIPNIYVSAEYTGQREKLIAQALDELLRVVRDGGEVRLGNVLIDSDDEPFRKNHLAAVQSVLSSLGTRKDIVVEKKRLPIGTYVVRLVKNVRPGDAQPPDSEK